LEVFNGGLFDVEWIACGPAAMPYAGWEARPGNEWPADGGGTQQSGIAKKGPAVDLVASLGHRSSASGRCRIRELLRFTCPSSQLRGVRGGIPTRELIRIHHGSTEYTESPRKYGSETITHSFSVVLP